MNLYDFLLYRITFGCHSLVLVGRLFKILILFAFFSIVASCGGGDDGEPDIGELQGSGTQPNEPVTDYGPFQDAVEQIRADYESEMYRETLTNQQAIDFFDAAIAGVFNNTEALDPYAEISGQRTISLNDLISFPGFPTGGQTPVNASRVCSVSGGVETEYYPAVDPAVTDMSGLSPLEVELVQYNWFILDFSDCEVDSSDQKDFQGTFSGFVAMSWKGNYYEDGPLYMFYDDLVISSMHHRALVSGASVWKDRNWCDHGTARTMTISLEDQQSHSKVLYDDFSVDDQIGTERNCQTTVAGSSKWNGDIAIAGKGKVRVKTDDEMPFRISRTAGFFNIDQQLISAPDSTRNFLHYALETLPHSSVWLKNDENWLASLTFDYDNVVHHNPNIKPWTTMKTNYPEAYQQDKDRIAPSKKINSYHFLNGALTDLEDSDADGAADSWELYHGLDPWHEADGILDNDNDEYLNAQEYSEGNDPGSVELDSLVDSFRRLHTESMITNNSSTNMNLVLEAIEEIDPETYAVNYWVTAKVEFGETGQIPLSYTVDMPLDRGAHWGELKDSTVCDRLDFSEDWFLCDANPGRRELLVEFFHVQDEQIDIYASVGSQLENHPPYLGDANLLIDYQTTRDPDFVITSVDQVIPTIGETSWIEASIVQPVQTSPSDLTVEVVLPVEMNIDQLLVRDGESFGLEDRCVTDLKITCQFENISEKSEIVVRVGVSTSNIFSGAIEWSISSDSETDSALENNSWTTAVFSGHSMSALVDQIKATSESAIVELPGGTYIGTLEGNHLDDQTLIGSTGEQETRLISSDPDKPLLDKFGKRTTFKNLLLQTTGGPIIGRVGENSSIEYSVIEPVPELPHSMARLHDHEYVNSIRLYKSTIRNWGKGEGSSCNSLLTPSNAGGYNSYVTWSHNVFSNNDCEALMKIGRTDEGYSGILYYVNNNVFYNNQSIAKIDGIAAASFQNNIVVGGNDPLFLNAVHYEEAITEIWDWPYNRALVVSSNLLWNTPRETMLEFSLAWQDGVLISSPDLYANPKFVDSASGNWTLKDTSPAIDAGSDTYHWNWSWSDYRDEFLEPAEDRVEEMVDGDLDGIVRRDIGAYEFIP